VNAFGDDPLIADSSAWNRARHPSVVADWTAALLAQQIVTCAVVRMELLYSTRTAAEFANWQAALAVLRDIPITRTIWNAAIAAMGELAVVSDGYHRVKLPDYLIAAAAQDAGVGVLHYDAHFDKLTQVFAFESRWIAASGSIP
jgi:predicted nucleic acid-binding protein